MNYDPMTLAKLLLPKTPVFLKAAVLNSLSLSANASKQDLRTDLVVTLIRELIRKPGALGTTQRRSTKDPGIKGEMWISKITFPRPEDKEGLTPKEALQMAIAELGDGTERYTSPDTVAVEAEWTGHRSGVDKNAPRPSLSEEEQYGELMSEVSSDATVLYFHGGIFLLVAHGNVHSAIHVKLTFNDSAMDPASHRLPTSRLAKLTSGRVLSVRYRLAPQYPFPSAILDALIAYLSLLSPPPGSYHSAVPASHIVLAGDSAGGNLSLVLLQTILTLRRKGVTSIRYHGNDVPLELPAGLALSSPWCDVSLSMPTCFTNAKYDYLSPPGDFRLTQDAPPDDDVWPTRPPRPHHYSGASALIHPLVSPISTKPEHWKGSPPVYICIGTEALEDESTIVARRLHAGGAQVRLDGYEGMPHCFGLIFPTHTLGIEAFSSWSQFITDVVKGGAPGEDDPNAQWWGKATWAKAFSNPISRHEVPWPELKTDLTDDMVAKLLNDRRDGYVKKEEELLKEWTEKERQEGDGLSSTQPPPEDRGASSSKL